MLLFKQGNVLLADEDRHVLIHGCNAQGVMGAGIAKLIRSTYPTVFEGYRRLYETEGLRLGLIQPMSTCRYDLNKNCIAVINAITQAETGPGLQLSYRALELCVQRTFLVCEKMKIPNIVSPLIGGGLAGGDPKKIYQIIKTECDKFPNINWTVYLLEGINKT